MNSAIERLVRLARAEVGVKETSENSSPRIVEYQKATWLEPGRWPWCAAFMCWLLAEWLLDDEVRSELRIGPKTADTLRCKDASAFGWEKWAKAHGFQVLPDTTVPRAGDIVIYDFSHIGLVVDVPKVGNTFQAVEGNTNGQGAREGDGVYLKIRNRSVVRCYIRMLP